MAEQGQELSPHVPTSAVPAWSGAADGGVLPGPDSGGIRRQLTRLHSAYGNQAILRMLTPVVPVMQTKLTVNQPGDRFEQEADRVADQVMRMTAAPTVQRTCSSGEDENKPQRKCAECEEEEKETALHRKETNAGPQFAPPSVHDVLNSPGQPLDPATRAFMEPRFRYDFSQVRVHDDQRASASARDVRALAYTLGRHAVFGAGQYAPHSFAGRQLLAHELAHVVQQSGGVTQQDTQVYRQQDTDAGTQEPRDANVPGDEGQNSESEIEWTSQGPKVASPGTSPSQNLGGGTGPVPTAASTSEVTLETGNTGVSPINNLVHQQICVDTGADGKDCFSFAAVGAQLPQFSSTWLGWSSLVVGAILKGEIYNPAPVPGATVVSRHTPTAAQAARWLSYMRGTRLRLQDGYSVGRHNCRTFSQWEFRDAPGHW